MSFLICCNTHGNIQMSGFHCVHACAKGEILCVHVSVWTVKRETERSEDETHFYSMHMSNLSLCFSIPIRSGILYGSH